MICAIELLQFELLRKNYKWQSPMRNRLCITDGSTLHEQWEPIENHCNVVYHKHVWMQARSDDKNINDNNLSDLWVGDSWWLPNATTVLSVHPAFAARTQATQMSSVNAHVPQRDRWYLIPKPLVGNEFETLKFENLLVYVLKPMSLSLAVECADLILLILLSQRD